MANDDLIDDLPPDAVQEGAASDARAVATRSRQRVQAPPLPAPSRTTETRVVPPGGNYFDQYDNAAPDNGITLEERKRLNRQNAFYTSSLPGAFRLSLLANIANTEDPPDITPERKEINKGLREEYVKILADLAAYDHTPGFSTTMEALVAFQGQLEGTLIDPTSWIGWGAKGATFLARTLKSGLQQGAIMGATDPVIQQLNIDAGIKKEWDPVQTAISAGFGFAIGGVMHGVGEGLAVGLPWANRKLDAPIDALTERMGVADDVGPREMRRMMAQLAREDSAFWSAQIARDMLHPEQGFPVEALDLPARPELPTVAAPPAQAGARAAVPGALEGYPVAGGKYETPPQHSFEDALAEAKQAADDAHREANAARKERGEEPVRKTPTERKLEQIEQRQKVIEEELGPVIKELDGFDPRDVEDILGRYDRKAGQHPRGAFLDALQSWAAEAEKDALKLIDDVADNRAFYDELDEFNRHFHAEQAKAQPAFDYFGQGRATYGGEAFGDARPGVQTHVPAGARTLEPTVLGEPPFEHPIGTQSTGGRAAEPVDREVPAGEVRAGESGAAASGGGERGGGAGAAAPATDRVSGERPVTAVPEQPGRDTVRNYFKEDYPFRSGNENQAPFAVAYNEARAKGYAGEVATMVATRETRGLQPPDGQISDFITYREPDGAQSTVAYYYDSSAAEDGIYRIKLTERADTPGVREYLAKDGTWKEWPRADEFPADAFKTKSQKKAADKVEDDIAADRAKEQAARPTQPSGAPLGNFGSLETVEKWLARNLDLGVIPDLSRATMQHVVDEVERLGGDLKTVLRGALEQHYAYLQEGRFANLGEPEAFVRKGMNDLLERFEQTVPTTKAEPLPALEGPREAPMADRIEAARAKMPDGVRQEFDFLRAMGADKGNASMSDERRFKELLNQYSAATERTAQGEQVLMEGVAPITDRERIESQMNKPMRGGDAPAGGLFDEGARAQADMFSARVIPAEGDQAIAQRRKGGKMAGEQSRDPAGTPTPVDPDKDVKIRSLQQQVADLAEAFDIPLRQGRVTMRGASGIYKSRSGVIRVLEFPDFEVAVHEVAHGIEGKAGQAMTAFMNDTRWAPELALLDYDPTKGRINEGFAEFVRLYVGSPPAAQAAAPTFYPAFQTYMQTYFPDMLDKLNKAGEAYRAYLGARSIDAVGAVRRSIDEEPTTTERVREALRVRELPNTIKSVMQTSYDAILDDKAPIARAVRELGRAIRERTGAPVDLLPSDNPEILARLLSRAQQGAVRNMMDGVYGHRSITPNGPALGDAMSYAIGAPSIWGKWDPDRKADFSVYNIARRADLMWDKFYAGEIVNPPVSFSQADARVAMAELEAAFPKFRMASDMVHQYAKNLAIKQFEAGIITRDLLDKMLEEKFYVPFLRDMSDRPRAGDVNATSGQTGEGPGTVQTVRKFKGSSRDIKDPIESLMMQTFLVERTIRHNDLVLAFRDLARRAGPGGGAYVEEIPAHEIRKYTFNLSEAIEAKAREVGFDPVDAELFTQAMSQVSGEDPLIGSYFKMDRASTRGEPIVFYKEGGELKAVRVMDEAEGHNLYQLLTAAPETVSDVWSHVIGISTGITRGSITTNPTFMVANYIRDQLAAGILRNDYVPIVSGVRGLLDEWNQANSAVLYGYAGGVSGGAATGPVERAAEAEIDALAKKGYLIQRFSSFKGLLELSSMTEAGTRNSIFGKVFEAKKRQGLSDYDAMIEAAFQAQDFLDFSRHGSHTTKIRTLIPFLNAHLQGLDKARRVFIEPITNRMRDGEVFTTDNPEYRNAFYAWLKAGAVGGGLGATWAAINWDQEAYRDASPYFKGTHVVVPMGDKIGVMPKPFELGLGFTFGEYAFAALMRDDPRAARQFIEAAMHSSSPPNVLTDIPLVKTAFELTLGRSMFTGRDIIPERLQGLPPELQYTDRTSQLAKWISAATGHMVSPIKVEYAIGAEFGNWGRDVAAMSQVFSEDTPAGSFDDWIFARRFVKDPTRSSDATTRFWDYMSRKSGKFVEASNGYSELLNQFKDQDAAKFLSQLPKDRKAYVTLLQASKDDGRPAFTADEKRLHPLVRAREAATILNGLRTELASNTFRTYANQAQEKMGPNARRALLDDVRELAQMEMRNALVIMKDPGYAGRQLFDVNDVMDRIRHLSPQVADEIATRYATAKVYTTAAVAKNYEKFSTELVRNGSQADIRALAFDAKSAGYEFSGDRVKKPLRRRVPIPGSP